MAPTAAHKMSRKNRTTKPRERSGSARHVVGGVHLVVENGQIVNRPPVLAVEVAPLAVPRAEEAPVQLELTTTTEAEPVVAEIILPEADSTAPWPAAERFAPRESAPVWTATPIETPSEPETETEATESDGVFDAALDTTAPPAWALAPAAELVSLEPIVEDVQPFVAEVPAWAMPETGEPSVAPAWALPIDEVPLENTEPDAADEIPAETPTAGVPSWALAPEPVTAADDVPAVPPAWALPVADAAHEDAEAEEVEVTTAVVDTVDEPAELPVIEQLAIEAPAVPDSFLGDTWSDAPVVIAPARAPEPAAPTTVFVQPIIQPVIFQPSVTGEQPQYAPVPVAGPPVPHLVGVPVPVAPAAIPVPLALPVPVFAPVPTAQVGAVEPEDLFENYVAPQKHGETVTASPKATKEPMFVWRGRALGERAPAGAAVTLGEKPAKAPARRSTQYLVDGIDPQTWFGDAVQRALLAGASDIHVSLNGGPKDLLTVRVRIDGTIRTFETLKGENAQRVMGIFKASAEFASGGSFVPEEAIYTVDVEGEPRKARAVLFRTEDEGDALVMRLPPMGEIRKLAELDFSESNLALLQKLLASSNRMLLVAGPMGAGKTTTSHAALMHVATSDRSVWTVEDPVERNLPGLTQLEVDDENGAGFDKLLPSLVRADYDTLFLGEIRDKATAAAGVRQAKAGRQVISTIHSNDNVTAVLRLIELAEDTPLSVMDAVKGVVSQRLVRRLNKEWDGVDPATKYKGRIPIHEVLTMTDELVEAVMEQKPLSVIKQVAADASSSTFAQDAKRLIDSGITDEQEVRRVLGE
jgi:type II secretory ATPase GspE/PulE/Tfp pilus assembly ATPase PilB-like protein